MRPVAHLATLPPPGAGLCSPDRYSSAGQKRAELYLYFFSLPRPPNLEAAFIKEEGSHSMHTARRPRPAAQHTAAARLQQAAGDE